VFDHLGWLEGRLLEVEAKAVLGAPFMPKFAEHSCLCFGREEEQEVIDVLLLDGGEGKFVFAEEGLEHVVEPDLKRPWGARFSHRDPCRNVILSVDLEAKICLRIGMSWEVVEAGRNVVVEGPLVTGGDVLHELRHAWERNPWWGHELVDVATIVDWSDGAVGLGHAEPGHGDERRCAHSSVLAGSNLGKERVLRSLI